MENPKESKLKRNKLSVSQVENLIDEWVFSERDRAIMKRRLIDAITIENLAKEFELSDTQIKRIIKKHQIEIFKHYKPLS